MYIYKVAKYELIYRKGDACEEVFFIVKGQMAYMNSEGHEVINIEEGEMFGEIEVLELGKRKFFAAT
jgi:CRP-like cAMP-binding protein